MKDFESFKADREKLEPKARKMSDRQWQQAYQAYLNSRERVKRGPKSASGSGREEEARERPNDQGSRPDRRGRGASSGKRGVIRALRANSVYSDLRLLIDLLAWVGGALIVLIAVIKLLYFSAPSAVLLALLSALLQGIGVFILRMVAQVIIDLADQSFAQRHRPEPKETGEH